MHYITTIKSPYEIKLVTACHEMDPWLISALGVTHRLICGPKQHSLYSDLLHMVGGPGLES